MMSFFFILISWNFFLLFEWYMYIMFDYYPSLRDQYWYFFPVGSVFLCQVKSWHLFNFSCNSNFIVIQLFYYEFQTFAHQHVALFQNRRNGKVNDGEKKTYPNALATISPYYSCNKSTAKDVQVFFPLNAEYACKKLTQKCSVIF